MKRISLVLISLVVAGHCLFGSKEIRSYCDLRFGDFQKQKLDFSCGANCIAYILAKTKNLSIDETRIIETIINQRINENGDVPLNRGLSYREIKTFLSAFDVKPVGVKLSSEKFDTISSRYLIISLITYLNQNHFVVVLRVNSDEVVVFDPVLGKRRFARSFFELVRSEISLVVL